MREVNGRFYDRSVARVRRAAERATQMLHRADGIARTARTARLDGVARLAVAESRVIVAARRDVLLADVALRRAVEQRREGVVERTHSASPDSYRMTLIPARSHTSTV